VSANFNRHKNCFEFPEKSNQITSVKLTHIGFETFPADNPDVKVENFIEGWTYILGTSL